MSWRAWTPAEDQKLSRLAERGQSYAEAADLLNRSYQSVYQHSRYRGISFTLEPYGPKVNTEREERVLKLCSADYSFSAIAENLKISRDAVAGIVYRARLRALARSEAAA